MLPVARRALPAAGQREAAPAKGEDVSVHAPLRPALGGFFFNCYYCTVKPYVDGLKKRVFFSSFFLLLTDLNCYAII